MYLGHIASISFNVPVWLPKSINEFLALHKHDLLSVRKKQYNGNAAWDQSWAQADFGYLAAPSSEISNRFLYAHTTSSRYFFISGGSRLSDITS